MKILFGKSEHQKLKELEARSWKMIRDATKTMPDFSYQVGDRFMISWREFAAMKGNHLEIARYLYPKGPVVAVRNNFNFHYKTILLGYKHTWGYKMGGVEFFEKCVLDTINKISETPVPRSITNDWKILTERVELPKFMKAYLGFKTDSYNMFTTYLIKIPDLKGNDSYLRLAYSYNDALRMLVLHDCGPHTFENIPYTNQ